MTVSLAIKPIVCRNSDMPHTDMGGEVVMMDIKKDAYYGLGKIRSDVWEILESRTRVSRLCQRLNDKYVVEPEQCLDDVLPFLQDLAEQDLIEVHQ